MELEYLWRERKRVLGMPISFTKYGITEDRFFKETGFLNTNEDQTQLYKITDITLKRSFFQKMFGLGTIELVTSDPSNTYIMIESVPNPRNVSELLNKLVDEQKSKRNVVFYESSQNQNNPTNQ